jgi:DNA topoisomerase-3
VINENYKKFQCTKCDFSMWKVIASRRIENEEAEDLIRTRSIGPLQGFRSRMGRPFAAMVKLKDDFTVELDFGQNQADERGAAPVDFTGRQPLGKCPKCGASVFDHELAYVCEKSVGPARSCDFRTGKIILQRPIEPEQVTKLLDVGKTDLLHRFISKKGRPFSAFLVRQPDGRVGFEFAPRVGAKGKGTPKPAEPQPEGKAPVRAQPKPAGRSAGDAVAEKTVYAPKTTGTSPAGRTEPQAARVATTRPGGAKKAVAKVAAKKPAAKRRAG